VGAVTVWGDFEVHLDQLLGRGGMGSVYRAWQKSLGRWVAVKVLDTARNTDTVLAQGFLQKFKVEIAALAKLNDPRIVSIIQAGENEGRCWFAMEFLEGRTLEARLGDSDLLSETEARRIGAEIARALGSAWKAGIVHRDIKPGNIFLLKDGAVKIADFGLARSDALGRTRLTDAGAFACTPAYASPEQIEGRATDHRSDIYSLGCVLYEMVTQRPPFLSDSPLETFSKHKFHKPASIVALNPAVSEDYEGIVLHCLEKHPDDRWGDYDELIDALQRPMRTAPESKPASSTQPRPAHSRRRRGLGVAALAGLAVFAWILTTVLRADVPPEVGRAADLRGPEPLVPPLPPKPQEVIAVAPPSPAVLEKPVAHRPSAEELAMLEKVLALSRGTLAARSAYDFASAEARMEELERALQTTPWIRERAAAELERLRAAAKAFPPGPLFKAGVEATVLLRDGRSLRGRVVDESAAEVRLEVGDGRRVALPRSSITPSTFAAGREPMVRAAAGDAIGVLGDLGEPHAAGVTDQAIEEALRAAGAGEFQPLRGLKIPKPRREALEPVLEARFRLLDEERAAVELKENGAIAELLLEKPLSRAAARTAAETLAAFLGSLPAGGDAELVGEIPWGTWEPDTAQAPGASARYDAANRAYVLMVRRAGEAVWLKKPFDGARKGYVVDFRFPAPGDAPSLAAAITFTRWIEISPGGAVVKAVDEGKPARTVKRMETGRRIEGGRLTVLPMEGLTGVWLDDRFLFALPAPEYAHEAGMQLGAVGGAVRIESIRVKDRSR
jgi:serine/threonine protein kinase